MIHVDPEIEKQIISLHMEHSRTQISLAEEFDLSVSVVQRIINNYRKECGNNVSEAEKRRLMEENAKLRGQNAELRKEVDFLKKTVAFFARENH